MKIACLMYLHKITDKEPLINTLISQHTEAKIAYVFKQEKYECSRQKLCFAKYLNIYEKKSRELKFQNLI